MTTGRDPFGRPVDPERPAVPPGRPDPFAPRAQRQIDPAAAAPVDLKKHVARREEEARAKLKRFGGPVGFGALLLWKVGRIALVALGKVAILFKIPLLGTVISGAVSIGAYALFFGWTFAIGLVASLLVHELGHVVQIRREGMPVKALNFVPFLGAYVLSDAARSADQQARVSVAGPIAGTVLAVAVFVLAGGDPLWEAVAYTGFFLNLFNLLPIPMLDGGGVGSIFTAGWWLIVAAALGVVALASGTGFAAIAAIAAVVMTYLHRASGFRLEPGDGVPLRERGKAAALYVAVIAVCAFGMAATFRDRTDDLVDHYGGPVAPAVTTMQGSRGA